MVIRLEKIYLHLTETIADRHKTMKRLIAIEANLGIKINTYTSLLM